MARVTALRHVVFEDLGILEDLCAARGWPVTYVEAPVADWSSLDAQSPDLLVILGGPIGAYEDDLYPFLKAEIAVLEQRLAAGKATLGICLGAQLMARALGAGVYPGPQKEIGWSPLALSAVAAATPLAHLAAEKTSMLHWHGDTFDLPPGATLLASTDICAHQVFSWGHQALAFQCHPEVRARDLEKWFVGHALEIAATPGVTLRQLREDTQRHGAVLEQQGKACLGAWLDSLKLPG